MKHFFLFMFLLNEIATTDYKIQFKGQTIDFSILPKKIPNAPQGWKKEPSFILPEGIDHRQLHMIRIEDIVNRNEEPRFRKLFIGMILSPIKLAINMVLGLLPPAISVIIKSPVLMGALMFYFVWYCIERIFFLKSLAAALNTT